MVEMVNLDDLRAPTEGVGIAREKQNRRRYSNDDCCLPSCSASASLGGNGKADVLDGRWC